MSTTLKESIREDVRGSLNSHQKLDEELVNAIAQYRPINESQQMLLEEIQDRVAKAAKRYNSDNPPESQIFQHPENKNQYIVFLSGDNKHALLVFVNGRLVEEQKINSYDEVRGQMTELTTQGYNQVDSREWYKRNWKMILGAFAAGAFGIWAAPLIAGLLGWLVTFITPVVSALGLGGASGAGGAGSAFLGKLAAGGAAAVGFTRIMDYLTNN